MEMEDLMNDTEAILENVEGDGREKTWLKVRKKKKVDVSDPEEGAARNEQWGKLHNCEITANRCEDRGYQPPESSRVDSKCDGDTVRAKKLQVVIC